LTPGSDERQRGHFEVYPWLLAAVVLASRALTAGPIYFADGPAHVEAARAHSYIIQPPGYWLFNRTIALFPDPEKGIVFLNWTFSVLGVVAFYYAARLLVQKRVAQLGAAVYGAVFYAWFAGDIHSTYASQLLFPVLVFLFFLLHLSRPRLVYVLGASAAYAIGAGFRPTDGLFLGCMFLYYLLRHAPLRQALLCIALATVLCLGWVVPTLEAYVEGGILNSSIVYSSTVTTRVSSLFHGITYRTMANVARFAVPVIVAFWPLLVPVLRTAPKIRDETLKLLWLWVAPGAAYLVLFLMADAPYLNFLTAAVLLLAVKQLDSWGPVLRTLLLASCLVTNVGIFLLFIPIPSSSVAVNALNVFVGKYTSYAIRNRWQPNLSDIIDRNTLAPRR
jgi:4-amino-4-deoxy-L-arabinose transferase-like glycosyltransferase